MNNRIRQQIRATIMQNRNRIIVTLKESGSPFERILFLSRGELDKWRATNGEGLREFLNDEDGGEKDEGT